MSKRMRRETRKGPTRWEQLSYSIPAGVQVAMGFAIVMMAIVVIVGPIQYFRGPSYSTFIGKTESEMIDSKGAPQWEGTDRDGRRILVYERVSNTDDGVKISHKVVYVEKRKSITSVSSLLPGGYNRVSKY